MHRTLAAWVLLIDYTVAVAAWDFVADRNVHGTLLCLG